MKVKIYGLPIGLLLSTFMPISVQADCFKTPQTKAVHKTAEHSTEPRELGPNTNTCIALQPSLSQTTSTPSSQSISTTGSSQGVVSVTSSALFDPIAIVNSVQTFYKNAWDDLIWLFGIGGALVGLLVPYLVNKIQQNQAARLREEMQKTFTEQLAAAKSELQSEIERKVTTKEKELTQAIQKAETASKEETNKRFKSLSGRVNFNIADLSRSQKKMGHALWFYLLAAEANAHNKKIKSNAKLAWANGLRIARDLDKEPLPKNIHSWQMQKDALDGTLETLLRIHVEHNKSKDNTAALEKYDESFKTIQDTVAARLKELTSLNFTSQASSE